MGGEKLNTLRNGITAILLAAVFILNSIPVYAQNRNDAASPAATASAAGTITNPEQSIILGETAAPDQQASSGTSFWIVLRMVLVLALAALAIYGVVFFIKRLAKPPQAKDPNLKVLASVPLGGDTFASAISIGSRAWLVGGGSGAGIRLISEITEQEALETMFIEDARKTTETRGMLDFRSLLNRFAGKNNKFSNKAESQSEIETRVDSLRRQNDRLRGLKS